MRLWDTGFFVVVYWLHHVACVGYVSGPFIGCGC